MKRLLLDLGNTRLKAAWQTEGKFQVLPVTGTNTISSVLWDTPDEIWLSSVTDATQTLALLDTLPEQAALKQVKVPAYQHHLPTHYAQEQLGVDRWLAMLACYHRSPGPGLVVDCGTAVTLDTINRQGEHTGGYILPGLSMMQRALLQGTAINLNVDTPVRSAALDSASAIALGARQALVALIEKMLAQAEPGARLFIGGGDTGELTPYLASSYIKEACMVLKGLACLADLEVK